MDNGGLVIGSRYLGGMAEMEDLRLNCYHRAVRVSPALQIVFDGNCVALTLLSC